MYTFHAIKPAYKDHLCIRTTFRWFLEWAIYTSFAVYADVMDGKICFQVTADPLDINILPEYNKDPRVVQNLIDGINRTHDDTHMWLAPFTKGKSHLVKVTFAKPVNIAMMRVWVSVQHESRLADSFLNIKNVWQHIFPELPTTTVTLVITVFNKHIVLKKSDS